MEVTQPCKPIEPVEHYDDVFEALAKLRSLATGRSNMVFRGQPDAKYCLSSSFAREYDQSEFFDMLQYKIIELINDYRIGLIRANISPFESDNILDWMEYGRHYGLPTPSIDFTYSPYIGLFFAFDTLRRAQIQEDKIDVAIYALDLDRLANVLALARPYGIDPPPPWWHSVLAAYPKIPENSKFKEEKDEAVKRRKSFMQPSLDDFVKTVPKGIMQVVPFPGRKVRRIIAQQGLLIYDTLHYQKGKVFEDLLAAAPLDDDGDSMINKITLPAKCAPQAWEALEQMGITPSAMYLDSTAAVRDAMQHYFYNSNLSYLRDQERFEALEDF